MLGSIGSLWKKMATRCKVDRTNDKKKGCAVKDVHNAPEPAVEANSQSGCASRRPKRHAQRPGRLQDAEEQAQILMAIKLSLNEQKKQKAQVKANSLPEADEREIGPESPAKQPKIKKPRRRPKPSVKDTVASTSNATPKQRVRKFPTTKAVNGSKAEAIPSTTSYISYILQQNATNRDMSLVRLFEPQSQQQ